jgi:hypothetical protein
MFVDASKSTTRLISLMALVMFLVTGMATVASAGIYSLTGNARAQIGDGLPLPITTVAPPNGKVPLSGVIFQTNGPDPKEIRIDANVNQWGPQPVNNFGLWNANNQVFHISTALTINGPVAPVVFKAGGGGHPSLDTATWCPGNPIGSPCTNPTNPGNTVQASIKYQKTSNKFGGVLQSNVGGTVQLWLNAGFAGTALPCDGVPPGTMTPAPTPTCRGALSAIVPAPTGVVGGAWGNAYSNGAVAAPPIYNVKVSVGGVVTSTGTFLGNLPAGNNVKSFGAPFTTGIVKVSAPLAKGPGPGTPSPEVFTISGSDNRVNGIGTISLVAGGVSNRLLSGDNANRNWLNYNVGATLAVPAVSNTGLVVLVLLFGLSTTWMVRRALASDH